MRLFIHTCIFSTLNPLHNGHSFTSIKSHRNSIEKSNDIIKRMLSEEIVGIPLLQYDFNQMLVPTHFFSLGYTCYIFYILIFPVNLFMRRKFALNLIEQNSNIDQLLKPSMLSFFIWYHINKIINHYCFLLISKNLKPSLPFAKKSLSESKNHSTSELDYCKHLAWPSKTRPAS